MNKDDKEARITLRLPEALRSRLAILADVKNRSMNSEIISRLEDSVSPYSFRMRLPRGLADRIAVVAKQEGTTVNSEITRALEKAFPSPLSMSEHVRILLNAFGTIGSNTPNDVLDTLIEQLISDVQDAEPDQFSDEKEREAIKSKLRLIWRQHLASKARGREIIYQKMKSKNPLSEF